MRVHRLAVADANAVLQAEVLTVLPDVFRDCPVIENDCYLDVDTTESHLHKLLDRVAGEDVASTAKRHAGFRKLLLVATPSNAKLTARFNREHAPARKAILRCLVSVFVAGTTFLRPWISGFCVLTFFGALRKKIPRRPPA